MTVEIHVCSPHWIDGRRVARCPSCHVRRRVLHSAAGWYGTATTCLACGYSWGEGAGTPTRSKRRRAAQAVRARERWRTALSPAAWLAAVIADVEEPVA